MPGRLLLVAAAAAVVVISTTLGPVPAAGAGLTCSGIVPMRYRYDRISITDFGGVGDGRTVNTKAFREAIYRIQHLRRRGGTLLYVPPGVYLTGSFNLTSRMTLYLARGAVIKAVQDTWNWPLIAPLPSYGRGRERPGGRVGVGVHVKTNAGRGGYIRNVTISDVYMENVRQGLKISGDVGDHPDEYYNPNALPYVKGITVRDVWGVKVREAGLIRGLWNAPFTGICLSNVNIRGWPGPGRSGGRWTCEHVSGAAHEVNPWPCAELASPQHTGSCLNSP
ncbi:hypothetical protein SAY87_031977 [Trapa incisa]|uniref:Pectate lyase superfamily protein domain-containing protein n=1 Tax=Trapa incisa TaxID=236973 RepID=A0AAN7KWZ4_9MYRT|nr:hypothetical protein SAY87_031977 [Trapa incisa]